MSHGQRNADDSNLCARLSGELTGTVHLGDADRLHSFCRHEEGKRYERWRKRVEE